MEVKKLLVTEFRLLCCCFALIQSLPTGMIWLVSLLAGSFAFWILRLLLCVIEGTSLVGLVCICGLPHPVASGALGSGHEQSSLNNTIPSLVRSIELFSTDFSSAP